MIDMATKETYSEVYEILNLLGNEYINKLPSKLYKLIEVSKSDSYNKILTKQDLKSGNVKRESIAIIALFHLKYWCKSNEEKSNLQKLFSDNEKKYQKELREKYNPDNIFKAENKEKTTGVFEKVNVSNEVNIVKYKESIFKKFINKIKNFFNK